MPNKDRSSHEAPERLEEMPAARQIANDQTTANRCHRISVGFICDVDVPPAGLVCEERRHEVVALGSELQHVSVRNDFGDLGHPIDRVCRSLLSICLGHRKDLALKPRRIGHKNGTKHLRLPATTGQLKERR